MERNYTFQVYDENREKKVKEIFEETWAINPVGIKENAYMIFIKMERTQEIPAEILKDKYIQYVNYCLPHQNEKFTKSQFIIKNLFDYISYKMYMQDFKAAIQSNPKRDKYLYGI